MKRLIFLLFIFAIGAGSAWAAGTVPLSLHDTTLAGGSTAYIPVYAETSLTGFGVTAYQLNITYVSSIMHVDSAIARGTLTEGWGSPVFHSYEGRISIAGAGMSALVGRGVLVYLKVTIPLPQYSTQAWLSFQDAMLNEGDPATATQNGLINVSRLQGPNISLTSTLLTVGENMTATAWGGTEPYHWSSTAPSVASIDASTGVVSALHPGFFRVAAADNTGLADSSAVIEVRAFSLTLRDTSIMQGRTFLLPVYVSDLSQIDVRSGQFSLTYNTSLCTALGTDEAGTLLGGFGQTASNITSGKITVSFAGASRLNGAGDQILDYIRFQTSNVNAYQGWMEMPEIVFNENIAGAGRHGLVTVTSKNSLSVSPNTASVVAGDSLQFSVWGNSEGPVAWSTSNASVATISNEGLLRAVRGGVVTVTAVDSLGATGMTGNIDVYDIRVAAADTIAAPGDTIEVELRMGAASSGISSVQATLDFQTEYFTPLGVSAAGTLIDGWGLSTSSSPGEIRIAAAGAHSVTGPGTLAKFRFIVSGSAYAGGHAMAVKNVLLNEGAPTGLPVDGTVTIYTTPPGSTTLEGPPNEAVDQPFTPDLIWYAVWQATSYRLQVSTDSLFATTAFDLSNLRNTSTQVGPLRKSTTFFWRVRAVNPAGAGDWSEARKFRTGGPELSLPVVSIDFGPVVRGDSASVVVKLSNPSVFDLEVSGLTVSSSVFTAPRSLPFTIGANDSASVTVFFKPDRFGSFTDTVRIASDGGEGMVVVTGNSPSPVFHANVASVNLGDTRMNTTKSSIIELWNTSINGLQIDSMRTKTAAFTLDKNSAIIHGDTVRLTVGLTPTVFGSFADTLYIYNNSAAAVISIPLIGLSSAPQLFVHPVEVAFGDVAKGDSISGELKLYNRGINDLTVSGVTVSRPPFFLNRSVPFIIGGYDSASVAVYFKPEQFGSFLDTMNVASDGGEGLIEVIGASPVPTFHADANEVNFGDVKKTTTASSIIRIWNTSINGLQIDSMMTKTAAFTLDKRSAIVHGDTVSLTVGFTPPAFGSFADTIYLYNNSAMAVISIPLSGLSSAPLIFVHPESFTFDDVAKGDSVSGELKLYNSGINDLTVSGVTVSRPPFFLSRSVPFTIRGHDSASVAVFFKPEQFGSFSDTMKIASDGGEENIAVIGASPMPQFHADAAVLDFGDVKKSTTASSIIRIWNTSVNGLQIDSMTTMTAAFTLDKNSATVRGDTLSLTVGFTPPAFGTFADTVYIYNNSAMAVISIPLRGSSPAPHLHVSLASLNFPPTGWFDSSSLDLKLYNTSLNPLNITGFSNSAAEFIVRATAPATLGGNDSLEVRIVFHPTSSANFTDTLRIVSDGGSENIVLSGFTPPSTIAVTPGLIEMGSAAKDSTKRFVFTIKNTSLSTLVVDSLYTKTKYFDVTHILAVNTVRQNDSVQVTLMFTPDSVGEFGDTLFIVNNSPESPLMVQIFGVGTPILDVNNPAGMPKEYTLLQNFPNPFNPSTTVRYGLPHASSVRLTVYNMLGQVVAELSGGVQQAGYRSIEWDAAHIASGVYFYRLEAISTGAQAERFTQVRKMLLVK